MKNKLTTILTVIALTAGASLTDTNFANLEKLAIKTSEAKNGLVYIQGVNEGVGVGSALAFNLMRAQPYGYYTNALQLENDCRTVWSIHSKQIVDDANYSFQTNYAALVQATSTK